MTRCGVVCGLAALAALSTALLGPAWLQTEEKLSVQYVTPARHVVSVRFKLGLFKVCPKIVKPANYTTRKYFNQFIATTNTILPLVISNVSLTYTYDFLD